MILRETLETGSFASQMMRMTPENPLFAHLSRQYKNTTDWVL